jgi:hypothetical protein
VLSTPRDAYSPYVARALRDAARADIEAIFRRVGAQDQTDLVDPPIAAARAAIERILARDGVIKADHLALISLFDMRGRRNLPTATLIVLALPGSAAAADYTPAAAVTATAEQAGVSTDIGPNGFALVTLGTWVVDESPKHGAGAPSHNDRLTAASAKNVSVASTPHGRPVSGG